MVKTFYLGLVTLALSCVATWATEQRGGLLSGLSGIAGAVRQADLAAPFVNLDADSSPDLGSIDTALEDWKAQAEAAVRAVYELQQQQEDQDDVPLVAYEHAVDMVHATADRLHDLRTHLEAGSSSSPDASLVTALQQAEEVLLDAQEHVKDAGVYFNHGAKKTAQLELQAALQEVEDAERFVQQHGAPQDPHALASRMIAAMHTAQGVLSAQAERLHNLAVYAAPHASGSSRGGEEGAQSCPQGVNGSSPHDPKARPCAFNGNRLYQQAQLLLGRLATAVHELQHYEKSGADSATISASAHTAEAFNGALSHMERWQDDPSSAYDEAIDGSSDMAEACRAATRLANESVRTLRQFGAKAPSSKGTVGHLLGGRQVLAKGAAPGDQCRAKWEL